MGSSKKMPKNTNSEVEYGFEGVEVSPMDASTELDDAQVPAKGKESAEDSMNAQSKKEAK